jgi:cell division transport system permease protein
VDSQSFQLLRVLAFEEFWKPVALSFLGAGMLMGVGGSLSAIRKFMNV